MKRCGVAELEPECFPRGFGRYAGALRCGCHAIRRRETLIPRGLVLPPRMSCNQRYAIMARTTFGTSRPRRIDSRALRYFPQECMVRPPRKTHFRHRLSFFLSFLAVMLGNGPNRSYRRNPDGAGCRGGNERTAKPPERMLSTVDRIAPLLTSGDAPGPEAVRVMVRWRLADVFRREPNN